MPGDPANPQLDELLTKLETVHPWPTGLVSALRERIVSGPDEAAFQINPVAFALEHGAEPNAGIQLLLHATRLGLMQTLWSLRCRGCGELVSNRGGLAQLEHDFYCASCDRSSPTTLDEHVEVSFTIHPELRRLRYHDPQSLAPDDYFYRFRFSRNIVIRGLDKPLIAFLREQQLCLTTLAAGEARSFELDLSKPGWVVGSPRVMITIEGEPTTRVRELTLGYEGTAFLPRPTIAPGPVRLTLRNDTDAPVRVLNYFTPIVTYFDYLPHLSGHRLLNDPEFRRCLGTDVVRPGTGIPVSDTTLLFTDLRGSTAMYDRIGDSAAFELVSEHFEAMARIITRCGGVVVKTMGDAIMASFNGPADAVEAALHILQDNAFAGGEHGEVRLQPKVGVHRGPCIVVNQNDMVDYFGQTVNIAARVQGQAGPNQLCVTQACFSDDQADALAERLAGYAELALEHRALKGVAEPVAFYRVL